MEQLNLRLFESPLTEDNQACAPEGAWRPHPSNIPTTKRKWSSSRYVLFLICVIIGTLALIGTSLSATLAERVEEHLNWLGSKTTYDVGVRLPSVKLVPQRQLDIMYFGDMEERADSGVEAIYNPDSEVIYLRDDWNADNPEDQHILVHELVHHLHKTNDVKFNCLRESEKEAYGLQGVYVRESGHGKEPDALWVFFASRCPMGHFDGGFR